MTTKKFLVLAILINVAFSGKTQKKKVRLTPGFKDIGNHNPCFAHKFTADPGVMVYDGRVYVYGTNDGKVEDFIPPKNDYGLIHSINCMSSDDLVNWSDHGTIMAASWEGIAKWAGNSWAPCAAHKNINGKEKFFLYFANSGNGIGVLTSDSPTGPWEDPLGHALIDRSIPNCDVVWLFDPAVLIDDDGTGYLYFGGGVPFGQDANPRQHRAVQLGPDMISLASEVVSIDAPWSFEDSGINKINGEYFYSYCTNWAGGPLGNARIAYMKSYFPLVGFEYKNTIFNNPGDFFGAGGNNHHTIIPFNNQYYIFYHAEWLNKQPGKIIFVETQDYSISNIRKIISKYSNLNCGLYIVDTLKPMDDSSDKAWGEFSEVAKELFLQAKKNDVAIVATCQLSADAMSRRFLDLTCIGKSKAIAETATQVVMARKLTNEEKGKIKAYNFEGKVKKIIDLNPHPAQIIIKGPRATFGNELNIDKNGSIILENVGLK